MSLVNKIDEKISLWENEYENIMYINSNIDKVCKIIIRDLKEVKKEAEKSRQIEMFGGKNERW